MKRNSYGIAPILIPVALALVGLGIVSYLVLKPAVISPSPTPTPTITLDENDPRMLSCGNFEGKWLEEHNECEGISESECVSLGGNFYTCESACRHDPSAELCIDLCVQVCKFNGNETKVNSCTTDKDCSEGYACDYGTICGGSSKQCQEYGTGKCYKLCSSNSDCSGDLTCQQKSFPVNNDFSLKYACFKIEE